MKRKPPTFVWVSYCGTCGDTIVAHRSKAVAASSEGCHCPITQENIKVARYRLIPQSKNRKP